jgi:catechol 2,3-dioxygenase-like lactoylglutathione lyase family enzyme
MIDHVSLGVRDLSAAASFYDAVLAPLGFARIYDHEETVGYGKEHPEFWLNVRPNMPYVPKDTGIHVCLRANNAEAVDAFHAAGLANGATDDGPPGLRPQYLPSYYAAFLRDLDGNRVEIVTFVEEKP